MFFGAYQQLGAYIPHSTKFFVIQMITANGNSFIFPNDLEVLAFSILGKKKLDRETGSLD